MKNYSLVCDHKPDFRCLSPDQASTASAEDEGGPGCRVDRGESPREKVVKESFLRVSFTRGGKGKENIINVFDGRKNQKKAGAVGNLVEVLG